MDLARERMNAEMEDYWKKKEDDKPEEKQEAKE